MIFSNKIKYTVFLIALIINILCFQQNTYSSQLKLNSTENIKTNKQQLTKVDLNGEWLAYGYCCGSGTEVERIMVHQIDNYISATKITGDEYVPAGKITWEGNFTGKTSKIKFRTANKGFTNPNWVETTMEIISSNEILLSGNGVKITLKRAVKNIPTKTLSAASISGTWTFTNDTGDSIFNIVENGSQIKVFIVTPSNQLKNTYKWNSGDLKIQGKKTNNKIIGQFFAHSPSLVVQKNCPKQWVQSNETEMTIIDENTIKGTRKDQSVNDDCSLGRITTEEFTLVRKSFNILESSKEINISLNNDILFDFNQHSLKVEAREALDDIKRLIIDKQTFSKIMIAGYTDDIGADAYNLNLSYKRAESVAEWIIGQGLSKSLLEIKGYGKENPRFPNINDVNRAKNRRVEIIIIK